MSNLVRPTGHDDSVFVVSMSGGKDSTATALALREADIPCRHVFADTGWEAQETYDHLALIEARLGISIARVGVDGGMVAKILHRAGFPARKQRWCTRELKVEVIRAWHDELIEREGVETVSVVGIRAEESEERAKMRGFGYDDLWGGYVWRPMLDATVTDVLALHHRHGIPVNPLYRKGFSRVGCNPCIYATKEEVRLTAEHFPARIDQIRNLERTCEALRAERNAETPGRYTHAVATFFQSKIVERRAVGADGKEDVSYKAMHVDDVVAWSKTSRGGRQLQIIREEPQGGCFRWGMCEPPTKEGDQ